MEIHGWDVYINIENDSIKNPFASLLQHRAGTGLGPGLNLNLYCIRPVPKNARAFIFFSKA